ncbi:GIY-YIG nuclease family protein [Patescibacteria group bacterium]|nr:MAG: GIY-YIG nuclease family protein [Patescibacteria group bacterium]
MHTVYVLVSLRDGRLYIGRTENLESRIKEHNAGKTWTTRRVLPVKLLFFEVFLSKDDAIRREKYLKTSKGKSTLRMMLQESFAWVAEWYTRST